MAQACNPSYTRGWDQEGHKFKANLHQGSLGKSARFYLQSKSKNKGRAYSSITQHLPSISEALRFNFPVLEKKKKGKLWGVWSTHLSPTLLAKLSHSATDLKRAITDPTSIVRSPVTWQWSFQKPLEEPGLALGSGLASFGEAFGGLGFFSPVMERRAPRPSLRISSWLSCSL